MLMLVTLIHVFTSYQGFLLLEGGIAYAIFYTYPLMILFLSGEKAVPWYLFISLIGVYILANKPHTKDEHQLSNNKPELERWLPIKKEYEGTLMIILAAITEAWIFFIIRGLPTKNTWNHMFLSYIVGAIFYTAYYFRELISMTHLTGRLSLSLVVNAIIGLFGYLLRFYSIANLPTYIYAPLSYLGIIMAYIYGVFINGDSVSMSDIGGTLMILVPNLIMVQSQ
jgi:drug/metabolite transporter (DMT)-like permease